jgi:hypothetical protein
MLHALLLILFLVIVFQNATLAWQPNFRPWISLFIGPAFVAALVMLRLGSLKGASLIYLIAHDARQITHRFPDDADYLNTVTRLRCGL